MAYRPAGRPVLRRWTLLALLQTLYLYLHVHLYAVL